MHFFIWWGGVGCIAVWGGGVMGRVFCRAWCGCITILIFLFFSFLCRFAFVEFSSPNSVPIALQYNGAMFGDRPIK